MKSFRGSNLRDRCLVGRCDQISVHPRRDADITLPVPSTANVDDGDVVRVDPLPARRMVEMQGRR